MQHHLVQQLLPSLDLQSDFALHSIPLLGCQSESTFLLWHCMPHQLGRASKHGEAATDGTSSVAVPDKARGHVGSALNAFVLRCRAISSYTVACHLLCATVATPLCIKGGPRRTKRGFRLLDKARIIASSKAQEHSYNQIKQD